MSDEPFDASKSGPPLAGTSDLTSTLPGEGTTIVGEDESEFVQVEGKASSQSLRAPFKLTVVKDSNALAENAASWGSLYTSLKREHGDVIAVRAFLAASRGLKSKGASPVHFAALNERGTGVKADVSVHLSEELANHIKTEAETQRGLVEAEQRSEKRANALLEDLKGQYGDSAAQAAARKFYPVSTDPKQRFAHRRAFTPLVEARIRDFARFATLDPEFSPNANAEPRPTFRMLKSELTKLFGPSIGAIAFREATRGRVVMEDDVVEFPRFHKAMRAGLRGIKIEIDSKVMKNSVNAPEQHSDQWYLERFKEG